jgi:hypothetical protein
LLSNGSTCTATTRQFGALYRRSDGKVAGVGTAMKVAAHDVVVNGKLLSIYARGETRFRVLRVRQVNPYLVVDAVPLLDEEEEKAGVAAAAVAAAAGVAAGAAGAWAAARVAEAGRDGEPEFTSVSGSGGGGGGGGSGGVMEGAPTFATSMGGSMDFGDGLSSDEAGFGTVGLYTLNPVDPQLESAWLQPLNLIK